MSIWSVLITVITVFAVCLALTTTVMLMWQARQYERFIRAYRLMRATRDFRLLDMVLAEDDRYHEMSWIQKSLTSVKIPEELER